MNDRSRVTPEDIRAFIPGTFPGDLGIEPLEITEEHAKGRILVDRRHLHPGGYVHGGVWTALADTVAAWVTFYIAGQSYGSWAHDVCYYARVHCDHPGWTAIAAAVMSFVYLVLRRIES